MKATINYERITPESAMDGDAEERGEYDAGSVGDMLRQAKRLGICEPSCSEIQSRVWFSSVDPDRDYSDGSETFYSLHLPDKTTVSSLRRIARILSY